MAPSDSKTPQTKPRTEAQTNRTDATSRVVME